MVFVNDKSALLMRSFSIISLGKPLNLDKGLPILEESILTFSLVCKDSLLDISNSTIENKDLRLFQCLSTFSCENTIEINCKLTNNVYKKKSFTIKNEFCFLPPQALYVNVCGQYNMCAYNWLI